LPVNIDMVTDQKICGSSIIWRGPGETFSVNSGTDEPVQAALLAVSGGGGRRALDRSLAKLCWLLFGRKVAFHRIAQKTGDRRPGPRQDADKELLDRLVPITGAMARVMCIHYLQCQPPWV